MNFSSIRQAVKNKIRSIRLDSPVIIQMLKGLFLMWGMTLRYRFVNRHYTDDYLKNNKPVIFAIWHGEFATFLYAHRKLNAILIVSPSKDGNIIGNFLNSLGVRTTRGSSTREGLKALLTAARLMKKEKLFSCLTVDGPTGPRFEAKPGIFLLAHSSDIPIVPVRVSAESCFRLSTWDKQEIAYPFSKVRIIYGEPWKVSEFFHDTDKKKLSDDILKQATKRLENDLMGLKPN